MASIGVDEGMILPHDADLSWMEFSKKQEAKMPKRAPSKAWYLASQTTYLAGSTLINVVCLTLATSVWAQQNAPAPDFSSNEVGWVATGDLVGAPGSPPLVSNDPLHPYVPNGTGKQPTYRIADLGNPNLKPWVKELMKRDNDEVLAGKIGFTPRSSCMPAGVPGFLTYPVRPVYFLQTSKQVLIIYSGDAQVRHVYLGVPHSGNLKPSWYGESVGNYEGDTLVVDTIGMNDKTFVDNYRTPHTEKLHVVERWKLIDDGKMMEVNIWVEDPDSFYTPWSAIKRYRRIQEPMFEEVCAENNALFNYHTPVADKSDF
jgi:hypothetical protein